MAMMQDDLDFYREPGPLTRVEEHAARIASLSADVAGLARVVQGLLIHRAWAPAYGVGLSPERLRDEGLRGAGAMLSRIVARDGRALDVPRAPGERLVGNCRHFTTLLTALLRAKGVPARARCGFGRYFEQGRSVDHWVCEYWDAGTRAQVEARDGAQQAAPLPHMRADEPQQAAAPQAAGDAPWVLVDAQIDEMQRVALKLDFDPLDVPRDRFLVAGDAWQVCRRGDADPSTFGIADMWGLWYVRSNLALDIAALNKVELLPWDGWGMGRIEHAEQDERCLPALDAAAGLSANAQMQSTESLRALYENDPLWRVPDDLLARVLDEDRDGVGMMNPLAEDARTSP